MLFPQAGVAIGSAPSIQDLSGFESYVPMVLNIIIEILIVHASTGLFLTRYTLMQARVREEDDDLVTCHS